MNKNKALADKNKVYNYPLDSSLDRFSSLQPSSKHRIAMIGEHGGFVLIDYAVSLGLFPVRLAGSF